MITKENNRLIIKDGFGTLWIEPWGKNSVRIRMTAARKMDDNDWALENNAGEIIGSNKSEKTVQWTIFSDLND